MEIIIPVDNQLEEAAGRFCMYKKILMVLIVGTAVLLLFIGCKKGDKEMLDQLKLFETVQYKGEELAEERMEELRQAIRMYEEKVNEQVEATAQLGEHYKMLAVEFMSREMYGEALKYFKLTIDFYPENEVVYYLCGVCSARMAKAKVNKPVEEKTLFIEAENYYLRAIELDNQFVQALYGLSVIYIYELDRIADAGQYLERIIEKEKENSSAMFLLAQVYIYSGLIEDAVDLYDEIVDVGHSKEEKQRAADLKQQVLAGAYE